MNTPTEPSRLEQVISELDLLIKVAHNHTVLIKAFQQGVLRMQVDGKEQSNFTSCIYNCLKAMEKSK